MAAGVFFQFSSAWIITNTIADFSFWQDYHLIIGQLMVLVLALRAWLLFQKGVGHWRSFKTNKTQLEGAGQIIKFYMSLFRFPLPNWFSYNPLWQMVYPAMLFFVFLAVFTGVMHDSSLHILGFSMRDMHSSSTSLLGTLVLLHAATAILQDWKGKGGSISAMLNGNRYFHVEPEKVAQQLPSGGTEVRISVGSIKKRPTDRNN